MNIGMKICMQHTAHLRIKNGGVTMKLWRIDYYDDQYGYYGYKLVKAKTAKSACTKGKIRSNKVCGVKAVTRKK